MSYERFIPGRGIGVLDETAKVAVGHGPYVDKGRGHRSLGEPCGARIAPDRDDALAARDKFVRRGDEVIEIAAERLEEPRDHRVDATHRTVEVGRPFRFG